MPMYLYECSECKAETSEIQKFEDPAPKECPNCGAKDTLTRQMSRSNFALKGGGWASDGYA